MIQKNILLVSFFILLLPCSVFSQLLNYQYIEGFAQGSFYHITYGNSVGKNLKVEVDSILKAYDKVMSIYDSTSIISRINNNDPGVRVNDQFIYLFNIAQEVSRNSNGAFDVTVGPLVNAWGFGPTKGKQTDSIQIKKLLKVVGYQKVKLSGNKLIKEYPGTKLDFNAIAQGYSVDVVASYFDKSGIQNYLIEIGGELKTKGLNSKAQEWRVGIDKPIDRMEPGVEMEAILKLNNLAVSTSGNYRKFKIENGVKYGHHIDPHSGYPTRNNILSATVVADKCIIADAYATAFLVLGLESAKKLADQLKLDVLFIYSDEKGNFCDYSTPNVKNMLEIIKK
jgi:thiamine biosynthesis lipoprotein